MSCLAQPTNNSTSNSQTFTMTEPSQSKFTDLKFKCQQCNLYGQLLVIDAPYAKTKEFLSFAFLFIVGIGLTGLFFLAGYEVFPKLYKIYSLLIAFLIMIMVIIMTLLAVILANIIRRKKQTLQCTRCQSTGPFE